MNFLKLPEKMMANDDAANQRQAANEAKLSTSLVSNGGFLNVVKYAVFAVLAALNFHLFMVTVPGVWGWIVGITAILAECFAIYCLNNYSRSEGKHQMWLGIFGCGFTVSSLCHALASLYVIQGGLGISKQLYVYSHYIAFPLIFSAMVLAIIVLKYAHWQTKVSVENAKATIGIQQSRANLTLQKAKLNDESELAEAGFEHLARRFQTQEKALTLLEKLAALQSRQKKALDDFEGEDKQEILHLLGLTYTPGPQGAQASDKNKIGFDATESKGKKS